MAFKITDDCINCGVCEVECPFGAILPGGVNWRKRYDQSFMFNDVPAIKDPFYSDTIYYVVPDLCTECRDFSSGPKCSMICPMDCIVRDDSVTTSEGFTAFGDAVFNPLLNFIIVN